MARAPSDTLTAREADVMAVCWRVGMATAEEIRLAMRENIHDSTVRTLLRVLEEKGYVDHTVRGKAYLYRPRVPRKQAEKKALRSFLRRFFGGSAEALVLHLLEDERLSPGDLEEIARRARRGLGKGETGSQR
jgi:BlaI family penicillinase repressor